MGADLKLLWVFLFVDGYLLTLLLIPYVLLQKKQSVSKLAWSMVIVALPYIGGLLFLLFGINRVARRAELKQASRELIGRNLPGLAQYQILPDESFGHQVHRMMRTADSISTTRPCYGNTVEILADTNRTLGLIEQAILSAEKWIHLEYYIWQPDKTGRKLRDMLIKKAREGVQIRFLFDGIGSLLMGKKFIQPMRDAGIEVAGALPGASFRERWSINLRNHRKIVVVDGQVGFTGGMNIGNEYIGKNPRLGFWRDTHLKLRGPTVLQLQQIFAEDWFFATGEQLTGREWFPHPIESGNEVAQVLAGGPDGEMDVFHVMYFAAINEAREQITLATSYFIPTPALISALQAAAYRGVRVRIMVPAIADHRWMVVAGRSFYDPLLEAGVEIYEFHRGPLHSKTITIDGAWSMVGSPNFDTRSLLLNFEVAVALYGPRAATILEEQFADDLRHARRVDPKDFTQRKLSTKVAEQILQLFSPVL